MSEDIPKTQTRLLFAALVLPLILIVIISIWPPLVRYRHTVTEFAWRGRYYDNTELRGYPTRANREAVISFDWGEKRPFPELPSDHFSARWSRSEKFEAGVYIFAVRTTGGARVFLDDELILDMWSPGYYDWTAVEQEMTAGKHQLRVEYFDNGGIAYIQFGYYPAGN